LFTTIPDYLWLARYNESVPNVTNTLASRKDGHRVKPGVSKLGRELREIVEKIAVSGEKPLTRRELEPEIASCRAGKF
jgi:hypothetical protein